MRKIIIAALILTFASGIIAESELRWLAVDTVNVDYDPEHNSYKAFWHIDMSCADSLRCVVFGLLSAQNNWNRVTSDGGKTWTTTLKDTVYFDSDGYYMPHYVSAVVYRGDVCIAVCDSGYYWRSEDRCLTWEKKKLPDFNRSETWKIVYYIEMLDNGYGLIQAHNQVYRTFDFGETWEKIEIILSPENMFTGLADICITDSGITFIEAYNPDMVDYIITSTDHGETWTAVDGLLNDSIRTRDIYFFDQEEGIFSGRKKTSKGNYQVVMNTKDGGQTWLVKKEVWRPVGDLGLSDIMFSDRNSGIIRVTYAREFWRTYDGGENWEIDYSATGDDVHNPFRRMVFFGHDCIYAGGWEDRRTYKYADFPVGVEEEEEYIPDRPSALLYPNPAQTGITISFEVESAGAARAEILDVFGVPVAERDLGYLDSGGQEVRLDFDDPLPPGLYWARISVGGRVIVKKFVAG